MPELPAPEIGRLRWRCRRGMRELDQLLLRYVEQRWQSADADERRLFLQLLDCEDDTLWQWFMGRQRPEDAKLEAFVKRVAGLPAA